MTRRISRLVLIALAVSGITAYFSCTQPDDIIAPVKGTNLYLGSLSGGLSGTQMKFRPWAQNLPTNPDGMRYELWVANEEDTLSLGRFGYNQVSLRFLDENGDERPGGNHFVLDGDIFHYTHIFVSVETTDDDDLSQTPGPIMLIDEVTEPSADLIELRFPLSDSLWWATAIFNMETPSDNDRDTNDGFGIWFSAYYKMRDSVRDTFGLDSFRLVTKEIDTFPLDTVTSYVVDIVNITVKETTRVFGLDSYTDTIVRWDSVLAYDSDGPEFTVMDMSAGKTTFFYTIDTFVLIFSYDDFVQFDFGFPDYSDYGWKYKGWVVSPEVPTSAVGRITRPAYLVNTNASDLLIPGIEGGLLSTGTFSDVAAPDDANEYSEGPRVPPIPGEDFLTKLPGGLKVPPWGGLVPNATGNSGTVFITLEPVNFVTDTTNFPLFVLVRSIPLTRDSAVADTQLFFMDNLTPTNRDTEVFPKIVVDIERF